jgi:tetratricopeptide (TPR) repeat protein
MDPYASCTCGSGKKFKWCCQPIQDEIGQVFGLLEQGQAEAASRMMDGIAERHPDNPQVWGQKAQLQYAIGQHEEAEKTLDKAFELFPTYPFGYFLKASFRMNEGELPGALLLLRKAAEAYDPNAHDLLAQIHVDIFNCEMKINHPIAARAALEMALRFHPTNEDLRKGMEQIFEGGQNPNLPVSASRAYRFKAPANATPEQKHAWENTLKTPGAAKLAQAAPRQTNPTCQRGTISRFARRGSDRTRKRSPRSNAMFSSRATRRKPRTPGRSPKSCGSVKEWKQRRTSPCIRSRLV